MIPSSCDHKPDRFCSSSHSFIPNERYNFNKMKIPLVLSLCPFIDNGEIVEQRKYIFDSAPKCYQCGSVFFPIDEKTNSNLQQIWICPLCKRKNLFTTSHLQKFNSESIKSKSTVSDFPYPKKKGESMKYSYHQTVFLFVLEATHLTKNSGFVHEALMQIKEKFKNVETGEVSIFLVNSYLYYPMIRNNSVAVVSSCEIKETVFPPMRKFFFNLETQKKLLFDYIDALDFTVEESSVSLSLLEMMHILIGFTKYLNIAVVFLASEQMVKGDWKQYKALALENLHLMIPFDFFLLDHIKSDFSILREMTLITNGFLNIYSQTQADLFASDLIRRISEPRYNEIEIIAKTPPQIGIKDIRGCGVRMTNNTFAMTSISPRHSVYYYLDYKSSEVNIGPIYFQFHIIHYDNKFKRRIRIINYSINVGEGVENSGESADFEVLLAGFVNQAIDHGRETLNVRNAVNEMLMFNHIIHQNKFASPFFKNQRTFDIMMIENAMNISNLLGKSEIWPLLMGKLPNDISLFLSPFSYQIFRGSKTVIGPLHISEMDFNIGAFYVKLPNKQAVIFLTANEDLASWLAEIHEQPLSEALKQVCDETRIEFIHPKYSQGNIFYQRLIDLKS